MVNLLTNAGLCNRLRSMDSTLILAESRHATASVFWPVNEACGAKFTELFLPLYGVNIVEGSEQRVAAHWRSKRYSWKNRMRSSLGRLVSIEGTNVKKTDWELVTQDLIFLKTDHAFVYPERFTWFQPKPVIKQRIEQGRCLTEGSIGIHIRRGDHEAAIRNSPLQGFRQNISDRISNDPEAVFFVCTDDQTVLEHLISEFGESRIRHCQHELTRSSVTGVENAVVELWLLSKCREIWGTKGSSFSETAFHLSGKTARLMFIVDDDLVPH